MIRPSTGTTVTGWVEHDAHVDLRQNVGEFSADLQGTRDGDAKIVHFDVQVHRHLRLALHGRPHGAYRSGSRWKAKMYPSSWEGATLALDQLGSENSFQPSRRARRPSAWHRPAQSCHRRRRPRPRPPRPLLPQVGYTSTR